MDRVENEKLIIQDLINMERAAELNLTPWYQRRSVWSTPQKSYLINTLLENKPIPALYIRHSLDIAAEKSVREVVDGQQRIRAILEFVADGFSVKHPNYATRIRYSQMKRADIERFKLTSLPVGYLLGATDEDVIEIFGRLNSVAKSLNAQEKRNAKFSGEYKQFCLNQAAKRLPVWRQLKIFTANDIARMAEVQFVGDLALNLLKGLSDYSSARLDKIYAEYDDDFPEEAKIDERFERVFSQVAAMTPEAVRDTIFSRPPLFFSLCVVLDSAGRKLPLGATESALHAIDENFNSDVPLSERKERDLEFYTACTASTQRIKQRKVRDSFIRKYLGL